jgi:hypothetical protein
MVIAAHGTVLVEYQFLYQKGISYNTINDWKIEGRHKRNSKCFYDYALIPTRTRSKLPTEKDLIALFIDIKTNEKVQKVKKHLENAYYKGFVSFKSKFSDYDLCQEKLLQTACKYALWNLIICLDTSKKGELQTLFLAYNELAKENSYSDTKSFKNAINKAKNDLVSFCLPKNLGNQNAKFTNELYEFMIQAIATVGSPKDAPAITAIANEIFKEHGKPEVSVSWVKNWIRENEKHFNSERFGQIKANKDKHYVSFLDVPYPNNQWQMDGYTIPMYYKAIDKNGKSSFKKLWLIAIKDSCSKKIMGYAIDTSENTEAILKALNMAIKQHQCIAFELVTDNHSSNETQLLIDFKAKCEVNKVKFTVTSNPQHKNQIERFFKSFEHDFLRFEYGNFGEGVKSKSKTAHISPELGSEYIKSDNCFTKEQIIKTVVTAIERYNSTPQKHGKSPIQLYDELEKPNQYKMDDFERLRLLEPTLEYTVTRKQIDIKRGARHYEFSMIDYPKYWDKKVEVITGNDYESIYVIDKDKGTLIAELWQKEKIHPDLASQTPRDKELLAGNARNHKKVKQIGESIMKGIAEKAMKQAKEIGLDLSNVNFLKNPKKAIDSDADIQYRVDGILINNYGIDPKMIPEPKREIELKKSKILEIVKNAEKPKEKSLNIKGSGKPIDLKSFDNL